MSKVTSEYVEIKGDNGATMLAWLARPSDQQAKRGLLVFQEAFGVNPHIRNVTERFAGLGFAAIAPELFQRTAPPEWEGGYDNFPAVMPHMQALTESGLEDDVRATYNFLKNRVEVGDAIACVGYCMGGRTSFLANSVVPLKAAISYYGGGIPPLLARTSKLAAPMLLFWGELDQHIPAEQRSQVTKAMRDATKQYVEVVFSNADHGFFCDARKSYEPSAARLASDITRSFLDARL